MQIDGLLITMVVIFAIIAAFIFMLDQSVNKDKADRAAEEAAITKALDEALANERAKPKSKIEIETYDISYTTAGFEPRIQQVMWSPKFVQTSSQRAREIVKASFARGYFEIDDLQIPTRNIKSTKIVKEFVKPTPERTYFTGWE